MIRFHKGVDWSTRLEPSDIDYLRDHIDPSGWYPMASFERMGNAILAEIAGADLHSVRLWGRLSVDQLVHAQPQLVSRGDPIDTLMRFRVLRATYFDFEALEVTSLSEGHAAIVIHYHMGDPAEEAASHQTMGFFERLLEVAGARHVEARFDERSWAGDRRTLLTIEWAQ